MPTEPHRHERTDVSIRGILVAAGLLAAATTAVQLVVGIQFASLRAPESAPAVVGAPPEGPPEPRLQTTPAEDLAEMRAREEATLHGYGWGDRVAGVVRIPIERAMELVATEAAR
jgi:hypothetical protein